MKENMIYENMINIGVKKDYMSAVYKTNLRENYRRKIDVVFT